MNFTDPYLIQAEIDYRRELALASRKHPRTTRPPRRRRLLHRG